MAEKKLKPVHPGEILLEDFMKPLGISINRLARELLVPPNRISAIVNGKRGISTDTALRLSKFFGTSVEVWIGLQSSYELRILKLTSWPQIEGRIGTAPTKTS